MADHVEAQPTPELGIPKSDSLVTIQAVDTTLLLSLNASNFVEPPLPGHDIYNCRAMAFLITHQESGRQLQFDFGMRNDYWNLAPAIANGLPKSVNIKGIKNEKGVQDVLVDAGVALEELEAVIWSHYHFDHTGDVSKLPSSVKLVAGEGFKNKCIPGYPSNPKSPILESDYSGREVHEIQFDDDFKIGQFRAHDYFSDGSFYLLDVPGHAVGHMCGLARTTANTFALLGGDTCHFMGVLRPNAYTPLPPTLTVKTCGLDSDLPDPCPTSIFTSHHPSSSAHGKRSEPFYQASSAPNSVYSFPDVANESVRGLMEFDGNQNILVCLAHDPSLFDVLPILSSTEKGTLNCWKEKGWKESLRWRFLNQIPRRGNHGSDPDFYGFWRDGELMDVKDAMRRDE